MTREKEGLEGGYSPCGTQEELFYHECRASHAPASDIVTSASIDMSPSPSASASASASTGGAIGATKSID